MEAYPPIMAAVPTFSRLSLFLHSILNLSLLLFITTPISSYALDISSTCPHLLTTSSIKKHRPSSNSSSLLVVVPWKVGFENFVKFNPDSCLIDGFSVQVFLQALRHMPPQSRFDFQFVLHGDGNETPSYEEMVDMVAKGEVDAVVADVTMTKDRMEKVGFTMPYLASSLVMVTPFRYASAGTQWDFLRPFSWCLWLSLLGSFVATGFALYLLENKNPDFSTTIPKEDHVVTSTDPSGHGSSSSAHPTPTAVTFAHAIEASRCNLSKQVDNIPPLDPSSFQLLGPPIYEASHKNRIMNAYWFTSLCVFAAQQESVRTHLGRFVTVIWLFVMLIFNSSYTASLASLLSAQKRYPTIDGFQNLVNDKNISVGYQGGSFMKEYMNKIHIDQYRLRPIMSEMSYVKALKEGNLHPNGVGAVLDELPYIQILLQSQCFLTKGPDDDNLPSWGGFAFAFRKNDPIIDKVSKMIVAMREDETLKRLQHGWKIGGEKGDTCSSIDEPSHLRLRSFGGLFSILCGAYVFCVAWRYLVKAIQLNGERCSCITNNLACSKGCCNICQQEPSLTRNSSKISDASIEYRDMSLEHREG